MQRIRERHIHCRTGIRRRSTFASRQEWSAGETKSEDEAQILATRRHLPDPLRQHHHAESKSLAFSSVRHFRCDIGGGNSLVASKRPAWRADHQKMVISRQASCYCTAAKLAYFSFRILWRRVGVGQTRIAVPAVTGLPTPHGHTGERMGQPEPLLGRLPDGPSQWSRPLVFWLLSSRRHATRASQRGRTHHAQWSAPISPRRGLQRRERRC